jgi:hypothetical protein
MDLMLLVLPALAVAKIMVVVIPNLDHNLSHLILQHKIQVFGLTTIFQGRSSTSQTTKTFFQRRCQTPSTVLPRKLSIVGRRVATLAIIPLPTR